MKKMSKLLSIAFIMTIFSTAYAGEKADNFQNEKFEQLKKTMWVAGLANLSMGQLPEITEQEQFEESRQIMLPEELIRPLLKKVNL